MFLLPKTSTMLCVVLLTILCATMGNTRIISVTDRENEIDEVIQNGLEAAMRPSGYGMGKPTSTRGIEAAGKPSDFTLFGLTSKPFSIFSTLTGFCTTFANNFLQFFMTDGCFDIWKIPKLVSAPSMILDIFWNTFSDLIRQCIF